MASFSTGTIPTRTVAARRCTTTTKRYVAVMSLATEITMPTKGVAKKRATLRRPNFVVTIRLLIARVGITASVAVETRALITYTRHAVGVRSKTNTTVTVIISTAVALRLIPTVLIFAAVVNFCHARSTPVAVTKSLRIAVSTRIPSWPMPKA